MPENVQESSVLIVAREPSVLVLLRSILESNGFRVLLARSAEEAVEIAGRDYVPLDILLSDVEFVSAAGTNLGDSLRVARPDLRMVYFSAVIDSGAIRIRVMRQVAPKYFTQDTETSLVEAVRRGLSASHRVAGA